jgi:hypothetical protein
VRIAVADQQIVFGEVRRAEVGVYRRVAGEATAAARVASPLTVCTSMITIQHIININNEKHTKQQQQQQLTHVDRQSQVV